MDTIEVQREKWNESFAELGKLMGEMMDEYIYGAALAQPVPDKFITRKERRAKARLLNKSNLK